MRGWLTVALNGEGWLRDDLPLELRLSSGGRRLMVRNDELCQKVAAHSKPEVPASITSFVGGILEVETDEVPEAEHDQVLRVGLADWIRRLHSFPSVQIAPAREDLITRIMAGWTRLQDKLKPLSPDLLALCNTERVPEPAARAPMVTGLRDLGIVGLDPDGRLALNTEYLPHAAQRALEGPFDSLLRFSVQLNLVRISCDRLASGVIVHVLPPNRSCFAPGEGEQLEGFDRRVTRLLDDFLVQHEPFMDLLHLETRGFWRQRWLKRVFGAPVDPADLPDTSHLHPIDVHGSVACPSLQDGVDWTCPMAPVFQQFLPGKALSELGAAVAPNHPLVTTVVPMRVPLWVGLVDMGGFRQGIILNVADVFLRPALRNALEGSDVETLKKFVRDRLDLLEFHGVL